MKMTKSNTNAHIVRTTLQSTKYKLELTSLYVPMQRTISSAKNVKRSLVRYNQPPTAATITRRQTPCDVFINHRGIDTKKNVSGLLYDHLMRLRLRPFLDSKNMKPGDKVFDKINSAITGCKVGVAVFSPRYCESYFCLHELSRIMEAKKKVIPVFCDVKPSELTVKDHWRSPKHELDRFQSALEEAKYTVGLTFNSSNGDWPEFLMTATEAIIENMIEVEQEEQEQQKLISQFN